MIEQVERRRFVRADRQPPRRLIAQLGQGVFQIALQILKPPSVFEHNFPGVRQQQVFGGPVDQLFSKFAFKPLNR